MPWLRATIVVAVALGLLSAPVECALAAGPHSIFQTPPGANGASVDLHAHHHDHAAGSTNLLEPASAPAQLQAGGLAHAHHAGLEPADAAEPDPDLSPLRNRSSRIASLTAPGAMLMALGSGGLDQAIPFDSLLKSPLSTPANHGSSALHSDTAPIGWTCPPEPPPPQSSSLI